MTNKIIATLTALAMIPLLMSLSCGGSSGGSDGDGDSTGITYTIICADPTPVAPVAGDIVIKMNDTESSGNNLVFDITVYGALTGVYDIAFHLCYDNTVIQFLTADTAGSVLDDGCNAGNCVLLTQDATTVPGKVIIGLTRLEPGVGINLAAGANIMLKLEFRAIGKGTFTFDFTCGAGALEDATGIGLANAWYAGDVSVN